MSGILRRLLAVVISLFFATVAAAQEAAATLPSQDRTEALSEAIEQAVANGLGVIVIDPSGNPVNTAPPAAEEPPVENPMEGPSPLMRAQSRMDSFRLALASRLDALPYSVFEFKYVLRQTSPDGRILKYLEVLAAAVVLLLIGRWLSTEIYGKRIARKFVVARIKDKPQGYAEKMPFLVMRFVTGIGATIFAMLFVAITALLFFGRANDQSIQFTIIAIFTAFFLSRTASDLWRMVLSPFLPQYRIPVLSDRDAKRLYYWASAIATYDICSVIFATWVGDFGLNYNVYALVYGGLAAVGTLGNLAMVLVNGRAISGAIRAGKPKETCSWLVRILSVAWGPVVIAYMIFGWLELAGDLVLERNVSIPLMAGTYIVLTSILVVYGAINYVIERYFQKRARHQSSAESFEDDMPEDDVDVPRRHPVATFEDLARRVAGFLAFVVGVVALIFVWNPDAAWLSSPWASKGIDVIAILFIGYIVYHMFRIWIDSMIDDETTDMPEGELGDEGGAGGASRLATLLPLFRGAILAVVVVSIILIVLMEIGINVSPLFAGAGVIGLAVGFGSQTLVRDIFSGAFFLLDDAFRKGEYIDIGDVKGTVEKISVRSFQLRHHLGALNTIPFGEIKVLTNYSRDWVMMKLPLRVTYDTDVEKVRKLIKKLGQELLEDPVVGDNFIQPLKSQGVIEMQDSAMIIRVKFMTKPGDQWTIRKRVFQEIRDLFEREGIRFAHREVTVRLAGDQVEDMTPEQKKKAAAGGVQAAIDEDLMDINGGSDGD
ncbi:mechanosensitive ion channel [Epibacterium sp. SM1979]|uniref:Mechanosensitive ion channel n=1 Tax=Tritonibacter litoralis TaxID=2662264 RepID=A0A843YKK9_9RHOB|nr:mechanosensitive ion channel domain-containing protein [Tritonibacter litoralis]MQQ09227.1 mechanosensitive ion channel [Tritonibacter litoralis]